MASAVGDLIAGKLAGLTWDEATLMLTFKDDVDGLKETMEMLQAFMPCADQIESQAEGPRRDLVKKWMKRFKAATYDVEDLLDEFETIELIKRGQSKIKLFFSHYNPLLLRFTIAHKIKKVKEYLTKVEREGRQIDMVPQDTPMRAQLVATNQATIAPTHGDIDIRMVGRDTEKEKIMKLLESEAEEVISIIPIVGLPGTGKTTLAQSIFSDDRTKTFDVRVWVYVSKKFDLQRIGEIILSTVRRNTNNEPSERYIQPKDGDLQSITEILETILSAKKYLIVLDDMWEEDVHNLKILKQMLQYGGKGSKIILTTRMQRVVDELGHALASQGIIRLVQESDHINLSMLSDDDCWNVMQQTSISQDEDRGLEAIGRQIAKKCAGLPLLARSLGFLLSQHKSTPDWEHIRDKKIILGTKKDNQLEDPLECLMLSYYYMPLKFKLCFTYCAVFPKGFVIASDHLIQQWRALGFIQSSESSDGYPVVKYLLGMSFLQISKTYQGAPEDAEAPVMVTMHDLVYDLATIILDEELIALNEDAEQTTQNRLKKRYCRHMQLINCQNQSNGLKFPSKIRSVHFTECSRLQVQDNSFSKSKYLRVLDISGCYNKGKSVSTNISLPSSIHGLMLLRYLDASGLPITSLPKSLHKLQNMQTLILSNCALETLPDNVGSLLNLSYLDLSGNSSLRKLPVSFEELYALWFLNLSACSKLYELPESIDKLISLRHLDMSGCNALQKLPDNFGSLPKLLFLNLSSCSKLVKLPDSINLKSLEHLNLSSCHQLQSLPNNFGNLDKLKFLNFSDCYKLQLLPESFCQLQHLKDLDLSDCHDLKELPECFSNLSDLQSLDLTSCSKLQSLPKSFGGLSKLVRLSLSYCIRLENLPSSFGSLKLQELYMKSLVNFGHSPSVIYKMTSLKKLEHYETDYYGGLVPVSCCHLFWVDQHTIYDGYWNSSKANTRKLACHRLEINKLEKVKHPEDAARAKLRDNPDLWELSLSWDHAERTEKKRDAEVLENLIPPRTLDGFELVGYQSRNFPDWMLGISSYLPYLTTIKLKILACDALPPLGMLPNLRMLLISGIPNITKIGKEFYGEEGACKKLRIVELHSLENLEEWWTTRSGEEEDRFLIPNLHQFHVANCPKLKFLPYPPKSMYWYLQNSDEVLPPAVHGFGRLSSSTLPFVATIKTSSFTADKWGRLQHLSTLEALTLTGSSLSSLPEATPCFPSLRCLCLVGLEILPEWLGQLITLEILVISSSPNLSSLPQSIPNLTALKRLSIFECPRLVERCRGEDAHKISHIPEVKLDGTRFVVQGQPVEE